jgi:hypothetical protein
MTAGEFQSLASGFQPVAGSVTHPFPSYKLPSRSPSICEPQVIHSKADGLFV